MKTNNHFFNIKTVTNILLFILCSVQIYAQTAEDSLKMKINSVRKRMNCLAICGGSPQDASSFFTPDYLYMEPNRTPVTSRDAYLKLVDGLLSSGFTLHSVDRNIIKTWRGDNLIYELGTANFKISLTQTGPVIDDPTSYLTVWEVQTDGSIQQKYGIWNTNAKIPVNTNVVATEERLRNWVLNRRKRLNELAIKGVNTEEVKSFFTEDYLYLEPNRPPVMGRDAYLKLVDGLLSTGFKLLSTNRCITRIWSSKNLIYEIGTANFKISLNGSGKVINDPTSYFTIWEIQSDRSIKQKYSIWNTNADIPVNTNPPSSVVSGTIK